MVYNFCIQEIKAYNFALIKIEKGEKEMYVTGKKARSFISRYESIRYPRCLYDVYKSFSVAKLLAWEYCKDKCSELNGRNLIVLSHNSSVFTAAFEYTHPDTGVLMLHVETYANSYDMEM